MSGTACQVHRARVVAGSPDDGPRWRFVAEDALRTAEFGDAGRLLLVRRLRLAGLPARPAPGQVARALEAAWAAQVRLAVPALAPGAAGAPAVWFASRQAAQAAWLAAWADDDAAALGAWYWPAALEGVVPAPPAAATPAITAALWVAAEAAAPPAWRQAVAPWPDRRLAVLAQRWAQAEVLPPVPGAAADAAAGTASTPQPRAHAAPPLDADETAAVGVAARRLLALPPGLPERAQAWLARHWLAQSLPRVRSATVRRVLATAAAEAGPAMRSPSVALPAVPRRAGADEPRPSGISTSPFAPSAAAVAGPAAPPAHRAALDAGLPPAIARAAPAPRPTAVSPWPAALQRLAAARPWLAEGEATAHGGLLLLLNLLPRLGFPAWLATQADAARCVDALFLHLLDATGAPPDDPQRTWFDASAPDRRHRAWRLRMRRALRRQARLDLGELVRRPALVHATPTHLDLVFPLEDVDLRLRRAGLDLDPGWVPWFGRIVSFHFL